MQNLKKNENLVTTLVPLNIPHLLCMILSSSLFYFRAPENELSFFKLTCLIPCWTVPVYL